MFRLRFLFLGLLSCGWLHAENGDASQKSDPVRLKAYRVPAALLTHAITTDLNGSREPKADGFEPIAPEASAGDPEQQQWGIVKWLSLQGVELPPGGEAVYDRSSESLIIRATQSTHDLIGVLFEHGCRLGVPFNVQVEFSLVEATLPQSAFDVESLSFHELREAATSWKVVDRISGRTKSGQRCHFSSIRSEAVPPAPGKAEPAAEDASSKASDGTSFAPGELGALVEVELVVGPDGLTMDLDFTYQYRGDADRPGRPVRSIHLVSNVTAWEDYPLVVQVASAGPPDAAHAESEKVLALVLRMNLVNFGGWDVKTLRRAPSPPNAAVPEKPATKAP